MIRTAALATLVLSSALVAHAEPAAPNPVPKPDIIPRTAWAAEPATYPESLRHEPRVVLLHHAGVTYKAGSDPAQMMRNLLNFSLTQKDWPDVPYHFVVAPDGHVFEGRDMAYAPDTNTNFDTSGYVNVELMGNFEEQRVSQAQLDALVPLVAWLAGELEMPTAELSTHAGVAPGQTTCPGPDFLRYIDSGMLSAAVDAFRAGQEPELSMLPALEDGPQGVVGEP